MEEFGRYRGCVLAAVKEASLLYCGETATDLDKLNAPGNGPNFRYKHQRQRMRDDLRGLRCLMKRPGTQAAIASYVAANSEGMDCIIDMGRSRFCRQPPSSVAHKDHSSNCSSHRTSRRSSCCSSQRSSRRPSVVEEAKENNAFRNSGEAQDSLRASLGNALLLQAATAVLSSRSVTSSEDVSAALLLQCRGSNARSNLVKRISAGLFLAYVVRGCVQWASNVEAPCTTRVAEEAAFVLWLSEPIASSDAGDNFTESTFDQVTAVSTGVQYEFEQEQDEIVDAEEALPSVPKNGEIRRFKNIRMKPFINAVIISVIGGAAMAVTHPVRHACLLAC